MIFWLDLLSPGASCYITPRVQGRSAKRGERSQEQQKRTYRRSYTLQRPLSVHMSSITEILTKKEAAVS
ncbi:hypothetical protein GDO78_020831 [Eleutherodactylus coqui]|uniref:Uncharacterized protein n=1 Tax=Eleutherodactylus coqui TaxID=57060 RepID=A0A8J6EHZ6_ELECQ|nr:hypothetical protein GDO78_020831 [Eleutherodactylus coqui]